MSHTHRTRYLLDATGRDTMLGAQMRLKRKHTKHQSAALFAHFRNVERRPGEDAGNISVYRFGHGWIWMIPLRDGLRQRRRGVQPGLPEAARGLAGGVPDAHPAFGAGRPASAWRNAEITGNLHVTGNYSYSCTRISGRRWMMVGDAYAFLDPIFSTGVYLAMHSAELAADVVEQASARSARKSARCSVAIIATCAMGSIRFPGSSIASTRRALRGCSGTRATSSALRRR